MMRGQIPNILPATYFQRTQYEIFETANLPPEVEKVVDSASLTRRKYLGNSDLAEIFLAKITLFFVDFWKEQLIL